MPRLQLSPIVVPVDYSDASMSALLAAKSIVDSPEEITAVHVTPDYDFMIPEHREGQFVSLQQRRVEQLECLTNWLESNKVNDVQREALFGDPGLVVCDYAEQANTPLIVLPSHGRHGLKRLLLGSVAERIIRHCDCSVLVLKHEVDPNVKRKPFLPRQRVVVPVDFSESSPMAMWSAVQLADKRESVDVISVVSEYEIARNEMLLTPASNVSELCEARQKHLERYLADQDLRFLKAETLSGNPGLMIAEYAKANDADLIVIPSHGYHGIRRMALGSVTERVLRHAECPVLVLRRWDAK